MAFQPVPETAEAVVRYTVNDVLITNTFYARMNGGYLENNLQDLADLVDGWVGAEMLPILSNQVNYTSTVVRGLANENDFEKVANAEAGVGGLTGAVSPNNVTIAVARVSGLTGRSARGRIYLPPIPASGLAGNENFITGAYAITIEDALNLLRLAIQVLGWIEVIVSRYAEGEKRAAGMTFPVTGYVLKDLRVDSQRARLF